VSLLQKLIPICALQAAMEGYEVKTLEEVAPRLIFLLPLPAVVMSLGQHMEMMKD